MRCATDEALVAISMANGRRDGTPGRRYLGWPRMPPPATDDGAGGIGEPDPQRLRRHRQRGGAERLIRRGARKAGGRGDTAAGRDHRLSTGPRRRPGRPVRRWSMIYAAAAAGSSDCSSAAAAGYSGRIGLAFAATTQNPSSRRPNRRLAQRMPPASTRSSSPPATPRSPTCRPPATPAKHCRRSARICPRRCGSRTWKPWA